MSQRPAIVKKPHQGGIVVSVATKYAVGLGFTSGQGTPKPISK